MKHPKSSPPVDWNDDPALLHTQLFEGIDPYLIQS